MRLRSAKNLEEKRSYLPGSALVQLRSPREERGLVSDDGAAKSDGPTMRMIGEEYSLQWKSRAAAFADPMRAAIGGSKQSTFRSGGPAFRGIYEFHIQQISRNA